MILVHPVLRENIEGEVEEKKIIDNKGGERKGRKRLPGGMGRDSCAFSTSNRSSASNSRMPAGRSTRLRSTRANKNDTIQNYHPLTL